MEVISGVIFHFIGGFASGSFYVPYSRVKGWSWENFWIIGGLFSWLIVPPLAAWLTIPGFADIIRHTDTSVLGWTYVMGLLWGIGGLTYGLGVRYLGMSLGNSITLGFCSVFGSVVPPVFYNLFPAEGKITFTEMANSHWGQMVLTGLVVCVIGIIVCGRAGALKEKQVKTIETNPGKEFKLSLGLTVAIISGILSACFNFGIEAGKPMAHVAVQQGYNPLFQNNVIYVVLLWGGLTTNLIWCMTLNARNKTFGKYTDGRLPLVKNYLFSALAGTTWFLQFFFYGMGESRLGNGASSWILHMAFIILIANIWGLLLKEWKGVNYKTWATFVAGIIIIITSVLIVGYGNSLK
jgi:L-rhamnose-H+ transport protein